MSDVIALSEISDEPRVRAAQSTGVSLIASYDFSPRMLAVLERLPANVVRISNALENAGIYTVAELVGQDSFRLARVKNLGAKHIRDIETALATFGLSLVDAEPPVVVRDGAAPVEAHVQRLMRWIEERMHICETENDRRRGETGRAMRLTEMDVLADVMLILDGREPTNTRRYST